MTPDLHDPLDLKTSPRIKQLETKKQTVPDASRPLPRQAAVRGPYTNTGSRDVGPDPSFGGKSRGGSAGAGR